MLEFRIGFWDYVTFLVLFILGAAALTAAVLVLGLPGKIARARNHPDAEAVNIMGWAGALAVVPWMQAFIWAFKPTTVVDIRRSSREEQKALEETAAEHGGAPKTGSDQSADEKIVDRPEK